MVSLKALEQRRAALDTKIKEARELEAKKVRFADLVSKLRPDLLDLDADSIKMLTVNRPIYQEQGVLS